MTNKKELIKVSFIFFAFEHHFVKKPGSLLCVRLFLFKVNCSMYLLLCFT